MRPCAAFVFCVVLTVPAAAQRTWVVDALNRPGTDFTDLPPAMQRAGHGDTVVVRPFVGAYDFGTGTSKGLRILGDGPDVVGRGTFTVRDLPAGRRFVLARIGKAGAAFGFGVTAIDCAGTVVIDRLTGQASSSISLVRCRQVAVNGSTLPTGIASAVNATDTNVSIAASHLRTVLWGPGIDALRSRVAVVDSFVSGGPGRVDNLHCRLQLPGGNAIRARQTALTVTGVRSSLQGGISRGNNVTCQLMHQSPALSTSGGRTDIDPSVALNRQPGAGSVRDIPALTTTGARPGDTLAVRLDARPSAAAAVIASVPVTPWAMPFGFRAGIRLDDGSPRHRWLLSGRSTTLDQHAGSGHGGRSFDRAGRPAAVSGRAPAPSPPSSSNARR